MIEAHDLRIESLVEEVRRLLCGVGDCRGDTVQTRRCWRQYRADQQAGKRPPGGIEGTVEVDANGELPAAVHLGIAQGWADAGETINVTRELVARGYEETDIRKLWSGNLLRVWRDAERVAAETAQ